ncbi:MAG: four helix bundle protein [Oligoflexia bacterium]|nr:four helix bundle protein [Oligoflexia bacterium]
MTRTHHLPIYASTYVFIREICRIKIKLPKNLKHDLGQESFASALKILKCIVLANKAKEKTGHLFRLILEVEVQWVMLRLLYDLRGISEGEFKNLSERVSDIEKQAQAWLKWQQQQCREEKNLASSPK